MPPFVLALKEVSEQHADPLKAGARSAYMRNQFAYLGIKSPELGALHNEFFAHHSLPPLADLGLILRELWALPEREYQYTALGLLARFEKKLPAEFIDTLEYLLVTKSWWDTVDSIAARTVGLHFRRYPALLTERLPRWRASETFWLRRSDTDFPLLCAIICENLGSKEFFINKAIGWSLREYGKVNGPAVREFVAATPLNPLSTREALKRLENA